jgi:hypothetical protein
MTISFPNQRRSLHWTPLLLVLLLLTSTEVQAATRSPTIRSAATSSLALGFESRLWEQLYRGTNDESISLDDEAIPKPVQQDNDSPRLGQDAQKRLRLVHPEQVMALLVTDIALDDAEELSDQASVAPATISEWNIAKLSAAHGNNYALRSNGGPTATTILVGLAAAAAIVLMGAMFSGKE